MVRRLGILLGMLVVAGAIAAGAASAANVSGAAKETASGVVGAGTASAPNVSGATAPASSVNGATKFTLYAGGNPFCDLSGFADGGTPSGSFAVLQYDKTLNQVGTTVSLKGALPNATYYVRILQGDDTSCFTDLGSFTTNAQGNGSISVNAPATSTTADVFVIDYDSFTYFASGPTFYTHA